MKITIEIDVQPDELRRFLGLPDIVGLQEDIIAYMKEKAAAAVDLSPTDFVRQNLDSFGVTSTFKKFVHGARKATGLGDDEDADEDAEATPPRRRRRAAETADDAAPPESRRTGRPEAVEEPPLSYDESSQTRAGAPGADDAPAEAERGATSALDAAEEIGAALAAVPRRALRSLRARAPNFGFNLDAARERRARARVDAPPGDHEVGPETRTETELKAEPDATEPAAPAVATTRPSGGESRPGSAAAPSRQGGRPAADSPGDPDEVF